MPMPLTQWDREVAPHLHEIEWSAERVRRYTASALSACHALAARPEFETVAREEIGRTVQFLTEALAGMQKAQAVYDSKQVDR